jgi:GxxExxY protein
MTQKYLDNLTYKIIGCAIEVHRELGAGLLESVYERCLLEEFKTKGLSYVSQQIVPVLYKGRFLDAQLRIDILVEDTIIVELKAVESIHPLHEAQLLTYMKLLQKPKGIIINFNCLNIFREGQVTKVNEYYSRLTIE